MPLVLEGEHAAFYRVLDDGGVRQTALVLLNKGDAPWSARLDASQIADGAWRDALGDGAISVDGAASLDVPAHGVRVLLRDEVAVPAVLRDRLQTLMAGRLGGPEKE